MTERIKRAAIMATVACAVVAVPLVLRPSAAMADVQVNLPALKQVKKMGDGTVVTVARSGERATINPSMGGTPLHRNVWVSAKYRVDVSKMPREIAIQAGYVVGCQVDFRGGTMGGSAGALGISDGFGDEGDLGAGGTGTLTIGPGQQQAYYINDVEGADDFRVGRHDSYVSYTDTKSARLSYVNSQIGLRGCVGYAQARSRLVVAVETEYAVEMMNFYGRPFSLG